MAIQPKQQVQNDIDSLYQRLSNIQNMHNLTPAEQVQSAETLSTDAVLLTQLKDKVQASFIRGQDVIPNITEEELFAMSEKLFEATDILDNINIDKKIQENFTIANDLCNLAKEVQSTFQRVNRGELAPRQVQFPNGRLIDLIHNPQINPGNRGEVERLQAMILSYQQPVPGSIPAPTVDRALMAEQDESFQVTGFHDRWASIFAALPMVPKEDFNIILPFYVELKTFGSNKTQFVAQKNKVVFEDLLGRIERLVLMTITIQKNNEGMQAPAPQGLRFGDERAVNTGLLQELKSVISFACNELSKPNADKSAIDARVQEAFSKASPNEKEQVIAAVNKINQDEGKRPIPLTLLNQPCTSWAAYITLQKAMEHLLPSAVRVQTPAVPAKAVGSAALNKLKSVLASAQENPTGFTQALQAASGALSENEKKELHKALSDVLIAEKKIVKPLTAALVNMPLNAWPGTPSQKLKAVEKVLESLAPKASAPVAAPIAVKASDEMAERLAKAQAQFTLAAKSVRSEAPREVQLPRVRETRGESISLSSIKSLQETLALLGSGSYRDLQLALERLMILESLGNKVPFKISGNAPTFVADRPCFHLYFIHKNESPDKLVNDMQYGNKAMAGVFPANNEERTRAIQRTIMELVLEGMEDAIHFSSLEDVKALTDVLQEVGPKLDLRDLLPRESIGTSQAAVFGELFDSLHRGGFSDAENQIRFRGIQQLRDVLKQAWKL